MPDSRLWDLMSKPASSGFRWLWLSLVAGLLVGGGLGFVGFWIDLLVGGGSPAARSAVGAVLYLGILALWVVEGALVGGVVGTGLAALVRSRRVLADADPALELGRLLQANLATLALGGAGIWAIAFVAAKILGSDGGFGAWLFVLIWMLPVGLLSLWLLAISSGWQKLQRFRPDAEAGDWKKGLTRGIFDTIQQVLVGVVAAAVVSVLLSGFAWAVLMAGWGVRSQLTGEALFGLVSRNSTWWWALVLGAVLIQAGLFAIHVWNLRGVAMSVLISRLANVIIDRLPVDRLPTIPHAPELFRVAVQAPPGLPLPLRWIWRLLSGKLDPVLTYWDLWTKAPSPRDALKKLLGEPDPGSPWVVGGLQLTISVAAFFLL